MTHSSEPGAYVHLAMLMRRLDFYRLDLQLTRGGLRVADPYADGCCEDAPEPADTVTCRPRPDDGCMWSFHSWGEPIAEVAHVIDAAMRIAAKLKAVGGAPAP